MTDTKHTPTPWNVEEWYEDTQITGGDGNIICIDTEYYPVAPSVEDMNHIVKCVNMHDELVEALEGMLKYIPDGIVECRGDKCREPWCASCCGFEAAEFALDQIRFDYQRSKVAIAKARGEEL